MHEVSLRVALTMAVIAAVVGVVALALGAFLAPIPLHMDATQLATAVFVRGMLALLALATACVLGYIAGYRIETALGPSNADPSPAVANSPLIALLLTPGPRRDAMGAGVITLVTYWFFTTIYIAVLGNMGGGSSSIPPGQLGSFVSSHLLQGLALALAGAGVGGLGARNAATRRITRSVFAAPVKAPPTVPAVEAGETTTVAPAAPAMPPADQQPAAPAPSTAPELSDATARADAE